MRVVGWSPDKKATPRLFQSVVSCIHVEFIQSDLEVLNRQQELDTRHQGKIYKLKLSVYCIRTPLLHIR